MNNKKKTITKTYMNECHFCEHKRSVPGNCHIECAKPDPEMKGHPQGIRNGWFMYPPLFDPTWKAGPCSNYEDKT